VSITDGLVSVATAGGLARRRTQRVRLLPPNQTFPEVMNYVVYLHHLRKSVWAIITKGSPTVLNHFPSRLHTGGYAGLYTPNINPWAVIHTATDVASHKLSARTGEPPPRLISRECSRTRCAPGIWCLSLCVNSLYKPYYIVYR
jgi:hypothetical protein